MTIYTVTFDVQRGDVVVQDSTTGRVCFTCIFVEGSQSLGCSIEYLCIRTEYNGQLNINRPLDSQNVTKCIDGIYVCDYNISFYDIEHDGVISNQPAYQLIQHSIDGLSPPIMSSSPLSSSPSLSRTSMTMSPTPTESPTIGRRKGMICITITYEYLLIITDGGLSSTTIVIIAIVIIIVIVIVGMIIIGEFIKLLLTLNDCYKFILVIVLVVIKFKRKQLNPSGEYNYDNYIIFLISLHLLYLYTCTNVVTVMYYDDDATINENKSNDEVSDEYLFIINCNCTCQ